MENPALWWHYAKDAVLQELRARKGVEGDIRSTSAGGAWGRLVARAKMRNRYVHLYTALLRTIPSRKSSFSSATDNFEDEKNEVAELQSLELQLNAEEILLYRGVARTKARLAGIDTTNVRGVMNSMYMKIMRQEAGVSIKSQTSLNSDPMPVQLSNDSSFDEVAAAVLRHLGDATLARPEGGEQQELFIHVNVNLHGLGLLLHDVSVGPTRPQQVLNIDLSQMRGELWTTASGKEWGCNVSLSQMTASGASGNPILLFGVSAQEWDEGHAALALHFDLCPLDKVSADTEGKFDTHHQPPSTYAIQDYLNNYRNSQARDRRPCQVTVELVVAPVKLHFDTATVGCLQKFFIPPARLTPLVPPTPFQDLRYLAACRRAYNIPSHVEYTLRRHVTSSVAVSVEAVSLNLSSPYSTAEALMELRGLQIFRGAYLEAMAKSPAQAEMASMDASISVSGAIPDVSSIFLLQHVVRFPSTTTSRLLQSRVSSFVERTYASVAALDLYACMSSHDLEGREELDDQGEDEGEVARFSMFGRSVSFEIIRSACVVEGHPGYPAKRLDAIVSPVEIRISDARIRILSSLFNDFLNAASLSSSKIHFDSEGGEEPSIAAPLACLTPPLAPRVAILADLIQSQLEVTVEEVVVRYFEEVDMRSETADWAQMMELGKQGVADLVLTWVHFSEPGRPSEASMKLARFQLMKIGFSRESVERSLLMVCEELLGADFCQADEDLQHMEGNTVHTEAAAFLSSFSEQVAKRVAVALKPDSQQCSSLFEVTLTEPHLSVLNLTYDTRVSLGINEFYFRDASQVVLLHAKGKVVTAGKAVSVICSKEDKAYAQRMGQVKRGRGQDLPFVTAQTVEDDAANAAAAKAEMKAITFTFVEQDYSCGWGQGGCSTACLSSSALIQQAGGFVRDREQHVGVNLSILSATLIPEVLDTIATKVSSSFASAASDLDVTRRRKWHCSGLKQEAKPPSNKCPVRHHSVRERTVDLSSGSLLVTLTHEGRPYIKVVADQPASQVLSREAGLQGTITSATFTVEDLSPGGEDYPLVVSLSDADRKRNVSDSMLSINYHRNNSPSNQSCRDSRVSCQGFATLEILITGMRLCFTYRFLDLYWSYQAMAISPMAQAFGRLIGSANLLVSSSLRLCSDEAVFRESSTDDGSGSRLLWSLLCKHCTIILPRNSSDVDLVALNVGEMIIYRAYQQGTWKLPLNGRAHILTRYHSAGSDFEPQSMRENESEEDDFYDALDGCQTPRSQLSPPRSTGSLEHANPLGGPWAPDGSSPDHHIDHDPLEDGCGRIKIKASNVHIFAAIPNDASMLRLPTSGSVPRKWGLVYNGGWVYIGENCVEAYKWKSVTLEPTELEVFLDYLADKKRYLIHFPQRKADNFGLNISASMAQLYLLISIYYDNMDEKGLYYAKADPYGKISAAELPTSPTVAFPYVWPPYASTEFFDRLRNLRLNWELGVLAPSISLMASMDRQAFREEPASFFMADNCIKDDDKGMGVPIGRLVVTGLVFNVAGGEGALKLTAGATDVKVLDTRDPSRTLHPLFIHCGSPCNPNTIINTTCNADLIGPPRLAFADQDFGLIPDFRQESPSLPLQVTLSMTPDGWMAINVGVEDLQGVHKDLSVVWLFIDFFSQYFRNPMYGHPKFGAGDVVQTDGGVDAYIPGGIDVRVIVKRPRVCAMEDPLAKDRPALIVEASKDVYYRYKADNQGSVLMDLAVRGLAASSVGHYNGMESLRRSLNHRPDFRILVQNLCLELTYSYDQPSSE